MAAKKHFLYPLFPRTVPLDPYSPDSDESSRRSYRHSFSHLDGKGAKTYVKEREGYEVAQSSLKPRGHTAPGNVLHLEEGSISSPGCFKGLLCLSSSGLVCYSQRHADSRAGWGADPSAR